jgi:3-oxoacyl-[acyl-carrier protein] reductase
MSFEVSIATIGKGMSIGRMGTAQAYANFACFLDSYAGSSVMGTAMHLDSSACPVVEGETGGGRRDAACRVPRCRRQC